jgi:hypothetical protein
VNAPYDHEALWIKAKLFINRAMDEEIDRSFDERCLWAALSLELLAKAALARISPLLIAEPTEDGTNLLIASGLAHGDARFTSVRAKTLFVRCQRAFKPFNLQEAMNITNARNEYLHSSGAGFTSIPQSAWWPRFWGQAATLVSAMDASMDDFVGSDRLDVVEAHLEQNTQNIEHRTEALIERARQRLAQHREGLLTTRVAADWRPGMNLTAGFSHQETETCPACGGDGILEGENVSETDVEYEQISEDDFNVHVTITVDAEYFSCPSCQLALDGLQILERAGLPTTFQTEGDLSDALEQEYGND